MTYRMAGHLTFSRVLFLRYITVLGMALGAGLGGSLEPFLCRDRVHRVGWLAGSQNLFQSPGVLFRCGEGTAELFGVLLHQRESAGFTVLL
jgi:hypothetical protein